MLQVLFTASLILPRILSIKIDVLIWLVIATCIFKSLAHVRVQVVAHTPLEVEEDGVLQPTPIDHAELLLRAISSPDFQTLVRHLMHSKLVRVNVPTLNILILLFKSELFTNLFKLRPSHNLPYLLLVKRVF